MTSNHDEKPLAILVSRCAKPQVAPQGAEVFFEKTQVMFGCQQRATTAQAGTAATESRVSAIMSYVRKKCPSVRLVMGK